MILLANKLTKRIVFQSLISDETWQDLFSLAAGVNAIAEAKFMGLEIFRSMQLISSNPYLFTVRYTNKINTNMRIVYLGRYFNIKRIINPLERNQLLKIITEEEIG
jgi:SPP1 family predicted phage head-tail adaptor